MEKKRSRMKTGKPVTHHTPSPAGAVQIETFVPLKLVGRRYKKQMIPPGGIGNDPREECRPEKSAAEDGECSPLIRALGLAFHWQRLLDEERASSVAEIAVAEGVDVTQVRRLLRLTLLAPRLVSAMVENEKEDMPLERIVRIPWPCEWTCQEEASAVPNII